MESTEALNEIKTLTPNVAQLHTELAAAKEREEAAETALLERVVEMVRPALRALSSRPVIEEHHTGLATDKARHRETRADFRGVVLSCDEPGPVEDNSRDLSGTYQGEDLLLLDDGTFVELQYGGTWSRWQGSASSWEARVRRLTLTEVVREYDLDKILPRLATKLRAYADGNASKRAASKVERADRLAALVKLL